MEDLADPEVAGRRVAALAGTAAGRISVNGHSRNGNGAVRAAGQHAVLVLNASYEPINVCTVRRAAVLVLKSRAEVLEKGEGALHWSYSSSIARA